jgi:protein phosphatase 2C family protein 2/3
MAAGGQIYQSSIKNKQGNVIYGPFRIEPGKLSVSRSFGDIEAKLSRFNGNPKVLIAEPEITYFDINLKEHNFLVMGSDGVYDKLTNEEVADCFWNLHKSAYNSSAMKFNK